MPFFRGLILILAIWLAFVLARQLYRSRQRNRVAAAAQGSANKLSVTVVPCEYCGLHIPKTEAITTNGRYFCSDRHRDEQIAND